MIECAGLMDFFFFSLLVSLLSYLSFQEKGSEETLSPIFPFLVAKQVSKVYKLHILLSAYAFNSIELEGGQNVG